jgi:hypothetical protein
MFRNLPVFSVDDEALVKLAAKMIQEVQTGRPQQWWRVPSRKHSPDSSTQRPLWRRVVRKTVPLYDQAEKIFRRYSDHVGLGQALQGEIACCSRADLRLAACLPTPHHSPLIQ